MEPSNDAIPRDEKQKAYELWRANQPSKATRRLGRLDKSGGFWRDRVARAAKRFEEAKAKQAALEAQMQKAVA